MPQMGVSVAEGTITAWRKRPGDWVERDETIVEISTDKVETEVPSPAAGRVQEILVEEGATVDVGTLLATIETGARAGEPHPDESASLGSAGGGSRDGADHQPPGSPVVRRIADEHHVDRRAVQGTGRRGRVTKKDSSRSSSGNGNDGRRAPLHTESPYREEEPTARRGTGRGAASRCRPCAARSPSTWCARCTPPPTAPRWSRPT